MHRSTISRDTSSRQRSKSIASSAQECSNRLTWRACSTSYQPAKLRFVAQQTLPLIYKGIVLDASYRLDLVVEDTVVVEVKSVSALEAVHDAQVLTYINLSARPVGLLINFNVPQLVSGVKRLINRSWRPT